MNDEAELILRFRNADERDLFLGFLSDASIGENDCDLEEQEDGSYRVILFKELLREQRRHALINKYFAGTLTHWERRWLQIVQPEGVWNKR